MTVITEIPRPTPVDPTIQKKPSYDSFLLLESGGYLLAENGNRISLLYEADVVNTVARPTPPEATIIPKPTY